MYCQCTADSLSITKAAHTLLGFYRKNLVSTFSNYIRDLTNIIVLFHSILTFSFGASPMENHISCYNFV